MIISKAKNHLIRALLCVLPLFSMQAEARCWFNCDAYNTEYPIVLVHGLSGFDSIFGIDYFYGVREALEDKGAEVYTPNITAWEDAYDRGELLVSILEELSASSGAEKFNLVGHSLGGPTIRYVAGVRPDLVASVTTVNAVNFGSDVADVAAEVIPVDGGAADFIYSALTLMGNITDSLSGNSEYANDAMDAVLFMTTARSDEFNELFPDGKPSTTCGEGESDVNGVRYYSWGGDSAWTNIFDISDIFLLFTSSVIDGDNDGLVERCDQHWGEVIGTKYSLNHMDAVNHIFGIHHLFETDPLTLYKNQAIRLKAAGL
jgi:triacylglycerol lipase